MSKTSMMMRDGAGIGKPIAYMIASTAVFVGMNTLIKFLGPRYPLLEIVFCRSLFAFLPILVIVPGSGGLAALRTRRPWNHVRRSATGILSMLLGFQAMTMLPLANATAIQFASPLLTTALAVPLLGETVRRTRWVAVAVGLVGVIIMLPPQAGGSSLGAGIALASALFSAFAMIEIRRLGSSESGIAIVVYFMATCALVSGLALPFIAVAPTPLDAAAMVAMGVLGGIGQICMTQAYRTAPASIVAPFGYCQMLWAVLAGLVIWGDVPTLAVTLGAFIVIASGVFIILRESRLGLFRPGSARLGTPP